MAGINILKLSKGSAAAAVRPSFKAPFVGRLLEFVFQLVVYLAQ